jgi:antitoxin HicB
MSEIDAYPFERDRLPAEENSLHLVRFPDLPGCIGVGESEEEALADGRAALKACLDALKAVDRPVPEPSSKA